MSKISFKTRKKRPNLKLAKNFPSETEQEQYKIASPQMRIIQAKKILIGQQLPNKFKFRQKELIEIEQSIKNILSSKKLNICKIIMVTGSPGGGKTLCVNNVLHKLQRQQYKIIAINSNMIKKKKQVQNILSSQLSQMDHIDQKNLTTYKITSQLEKYKNKKCILYVQEIQIFFNSHVQFISQDFFQIFFNKHLKILLLGISNTIDALQKYGGKLKIKVDQVTNIVFHPYTIDQIKQIMVDKIQQVQKSTGIHIKFSESLLKFSANKINQLKKGDMRVAFEFLKALGKNIFSGINIGQIPNQISVNIDIINKSLSCLNLEIYKLINNLPFQQQVVLLAIYNYFIQTQQISITEQKLKIKIKQIYNWLGIQYKKQINEQISSLIDYNMIQIKSKLENKQIKFNRYLLKIQMNQIKFCFQQHPVLKKLV